MNHKCETAQQELWECAAERKDLPEELSQQAWTCRFCAKALREIEDVCSRFGEASRVPEAPDCRDEVLARIRTRSPNPGSAWAYGLAAVLVVAVVVFSTRAFIFSHRIGPEVVVGPKPAPSGIASPHVGAGRSTGVSPISSTHRHSVGGTRQAVVSVTNAPAQEHRRRNHIRRNRPRPILVQLPKPELPVLFVEATLVRDQIDNHKSYRYIDIDSETGKTTVCAVTRTGNLISIQLESTPTDRVQGKG